MRQNSRPLSAEKELGEKSLRLGIFCHTKSNETSIIFYVSVFIFFFSNSDQDKFVQMASLSPAHQAQSKPLTWIQKLSCSENQLFVPRLQDTMGGLLSASLENFNLETNKETGTEGIRDRWVSSVL